MAGSSTQTETTQETHGATETGLDEHVASALAYVLGFVTGIVLFLVESKNETVRFHAAQSTVVFGGIFLVSIALSFLQAVLGFGNVAGFLFGAIFGLLSFVVSIVALILWLYLIARSYQGRNPRVPVAAGIAEDFV
jgi:uncharacterized membrane protein